MFFLLESGHILVNVYRRVSVHLLYRSTSSDFGVMDHMRGYVRQYLEMHSMGYGEIEQEYTRYCVRVRVRLLEEMLIVLVIVRCLCSKMFCHFKW